MKGCALRTGRRWVDSGYEEKIHQRKYLSKSTQMELWEQLVGTWKDSRTASEIIEDIYSLRTAGRDVEL